MTPQELDNYIPLTRQLVAEGRYAEALARYMWFHDNILSHRKNQAGVRLAVAIAEWFVLGNTYPPARAAFVAVRDRDRATLLAGGGDSMLFYDLMHFNSVIDGEADTLGLLENIAKEHPQLAQSCWPVAYEAVLNARRFDLFATLMPEPIEILKVITTVFATKLGLARDKGPGHQHEVEQVTANFEARIGQLAEAARATGKEEQAQLVDDAARAAITAAAEA